MCDEEEYHAAAGRRGSACLAEVEYMDLSTLSDEDLKTARARSPLLSGVDIEVCVPIPKDVFRKWLVIASGSDVVAEEGVHLLRVASFLQDAETLNKLLSGVSARMATAIENSPEWAKSWKFCKEMDAEGELICDSREGSGAQASQAGVGETLQGLCPTPDLQEMHPHDIFSALATLPLHVVARLPPAVQLEALSSRAASTASNPSPDCRAPALLTDGLTSCEVARILFCAARLPGPCLRCISVRCCFRRATTARTAACGKFHRCDRIGSAIAAALRAHATALHELHLDDVVLTPECTTMLAAALRSSQLRLQEITLNGVVFRRDVRMRASNDLLAAVGAQSQMTRLNINWWDKFIHIHGLDLSKLPRLRRLWLRHDRPEALCSWLAREISSAHLSHLTELHILEMPGLGPACKPHLQDIAGNLHNLLALRSLSVRAGHLVPFMAALSTRARQMLNPVCFPHLETLRVNVTGSTPPLDLPLAWLACHTRLQEISVRADGPAWRRTAVDIAHLARTAAQLPALTLLDLTGIRAVNCPGGRAEDFNTVVRALAAAPRLQTLRLRGLAFEGRKQAAAAAAPRAPTVTEQQRQWLRIFEGTPPQHRTACDAPRMHVPGPISPELRELELSGCGFSASDVLWLGLDSAPHLTEVTLSGNHLGGDMRDAYFTAGSAGAQLVGLFKRLFARGLRHLALEWNDIEAFGAFAFIRALVPDQEGESDEEDELDPAAASFCIYDNPEHGVPDIAMTGRAVKRMLRAWCCGERRPSGTAESGLPGTGAAVSDPA